MRGDHSDVFTRLLTAEKPARASLFEHEDDKNNASQRQTSINKFSVLERSKTMTENNFQSGPCNAVYPKKKQSSVSSKSVIKDKDSSDFLANDDIGIRFYRTAVEARTEKKEAFERLNENWKLIKLENYST